MGFDNAFAYSQSKSHSLGFGCLEGFPETAHYVLGDTASSIGDPDFQVVANLCTFYCKEPAFRHCINGVCGKVDENSLDLRDVDKYSWFILRKIPHRYGFRYLDSE